MSEYQYYEFQAIDRPLDERAVTALRSITSRARITPTSLVNVYHFGDFKGDPDRLMDQYFDAFLYVANWGTRRLMLRLPRRLFDPDAAKPYVVPYVLNARATKEHVVLDFHSDTEDGEDFEEGEGWLAALVPLRADLLAGDLRCLYLAYLSGVQREDVDDEADQPPIPPGLGNLTASLRRFTGFLRLDPDLLAAASAASGEAVAGPSPDEVADWVARLPDADKSAVLVRLMQGEAAHLGNELLLRFRRERNRTAVRQGQGGPPREERRSVADLRDAWQMRAEEERSRAAERAAREAARRAREQAAARAKHLDALAGQESQLWRQVEAAIATRQPKEYDRAVSLLNDLHDLGERSGDAESVAARIRKLRTQPGGKRTLIQRLDRAGLPQ
jgi:hypothetical protein